MLVPHGPIDNYNEIHLNCKLFFYFFCINCAIFMNKIASHRKISFCMQNPASYLSTLDLKAIAVPDSAEVPAPRQFS